MFKGTRILITGGTGSWGEELIRQLLPQFPQEIIVFSRNEFSQVKMRRKIADKRVTFWIGDVRDLHALQQACQGVHIIFHLAALKHVPVCEQHPLEALKTNVMGTQNVIRAAIANQVEKVIHISTDKAANPSNFYGMTKAMSERLIIAANRLERDTKFVCVRAGNVLGTNGSVVHIFKEQIKQRQPIGLTDRRMTRFFMTLTHAIQLLFRATKAGIGGETFIMRMPTCRIVDLAEVLMEQLHTQSEMLEIGIRPGEKLHEILFTEFESKSTILYDTQYFVVLPVLEIPALNKHYANYPPLDFANYCANPHMMNKEQIRSLLYEGGFLQ